MPGRPGLGDLLDLPPLDWRELRRMAALVSRVERSEPVGVEVADDIEARVAELIRLGASVERRTQHDDPEDPIYYVIMHDPEGNEFCVS